MKHGVKVKKAFYKCLEVVMSVLVRTLHWLSRMFANVEVWAISKSAKL